MKLLGNSQSWEIVQNMSLGDSSPRTVSIWLAFVTGANVLDSQKCFITSHNSSLGNKLVVVVVVVKSVV